MVAATTLDSQENAPSYLKLCANCWYAYFRQAYVRVCRNDGPNIRTYQSQGKIKQLKSANSSHIGQIIN